MNYKGLMIGNYFRDRMGVLCAVENLSNDDEGVRIVAVDSALTQLPVDPIPLSKDWLTLLGFTRLGKRKMWTKGKVCVILMDYNDFERKTKGNIFYIGYKDMGNAIYHTQFELPYVHTLQNAFALTGEELTIES